MPPENFKPERCHLRVARARGLAVPPNLVQLGRRDLQDRRADNGKSPRNPLPIPSLPKNSKLDLNQRDVAKRNVDIGLTTRPARVAAGAARSPIIFLEKMVVEADPEGGEMQKRVDTAEMLDRHGPLRADPTA
jgi:hypothetical protein